MVPSENAKKQRTPVNYLGLLPMDLFFDSYLQFRPRKRPLDIHDPEDCLACSTKGLVLAFAESSRTMLPL